MVKRLVVVLLLTVLGIFGLSTGHSVHAQDTEVLLDIQKCSGPSDIGGDIWITPAGSTYLEMFVASGTSVYVYDLAHQSALVTIHSFPEGVLQVRQVEFGQKIQVVYVTTEHALYRFYLGGVQGTAWIPYGVFYNLTTRFVIESIDLHNAMIIGQGKDIYIETYSQETNQNLPLGDQLRGHLDIEFPWPDDTIVRGWDDFATDADQTLYAVSHLQGIWKFALDRFNVDNDPFYVARSYGALDIPKEQAWEVRGYPEQYITVLNGGFGPGSEDPARIIGINDNTIRDIPNGADALMTEHGAVVSTYMDGIVFVTFLGNQINEEHRVVFPEDTKTWTMARNWRDIYVKTYDYGILLFKDGEETKSPKQICLGDQLPHRLFLPSLFRVNTSWMGELSTPRPGDWPTPTPRRGPETPSPAPWPTARLTSVVPF